MKLLRVPQLRVIVDLRVMAMEGHTTFPRSSEQETYHRTQLCHPQYAVIKLIGEAKHAHTHTYIYVYIIFLLDLIKSC